MIGTAPPSRVASLEDLKREVRAHYDRLASSRDRWYARNWYYHAYIERQIRCTVPASSSVLELGCATGNLLAALRPARGVGLDLSPVMVEIARRKYPHLSFQVGDAETFDIGEKFDFIIASDLVGELSDIASMLERVQTVSHDDTRLILTFHNPALELAMRAAQRLGWALPPSRQNWIGPRDLANLLKLSEFALERADLGFLIPRHVPGLARVGNRYLSRVRGIRYLDLVNAMVARPQRPRPVARPLSCTVVIPCRNEVDNVEAAIQRTPPMGTWTELIFVDGASTDGTRERIEEMMERYRGERDIRLILQVAHSDYPEKRQHADAPITMLRLGKGDAVRKGFEAAHGDVLMILDADLSVPPEDLPRFFSAVATGKGDFINGTRLVYPMQERAMKFVNYLGNKFFSVLFTWLLEQPIRDTLCGTKVLLRDDYQRIKAGRAHFGEFDPFGDFDLLFGAARLKLRILDVPVRYRRRLSGVSKVRVARHGWLLIAMSFIAFRKLKLAKWHRRR